MAEDKEKILEQIHCIYQDTVEEYVKRTRESIAFNSEYSQREIELVYLVVRWTGQRSTRSQRPGIILKNF